MAVQMTRQLKDIQSKIAAAYEIALDMRKKDSYTSQQVDITLVNTLAERVAGLIATIQPQLDTQLLAQRIIQLEQQYKKLDWRVAFSIAYETARGDFFNFDNQILAMETGIRVGFSYMTVGVVSAPLEGFVGLKKTKNGSLEIQFAGPIRNAGGTAASVCVMIADYVRKKCGYPPFTASKDDIKHMQQEVELYHTRQANLQYYPTPQQIQLLLENVPLAIGGNSTSTIQVSNKSPNISTDKLRGGVCLIVSECLIAKSAKLFKQMTQWGQEFEMEHWLFTQQLIAKPSTTTTSRMLDDTLAGRPILGYPNHTGSFRLQYGRSRNSGYSSQSVHPSTLKVLDNFIAIGTQLRVERPGKATAITTCDTIQPALVKLKTGDVVYADTLNDDTVSQVERILFLGDILINYGDFLDRACPLLPCGYSHKWWLLDVAKASQTNPNKTTLNKTTPSHNTPIPSYQQAKKISIQYNVPLHPQYTPFWKAIDRASIQYLHTIINKDKTIEKGSFPYTQQSKQCLEQLGIPHTIKEQHLEIPPGYGEMFIDIFYKKTLPTTSNILDLINTLAPYRIADTLGTTLGAKMGRPEKAKIRRLTGGLHGLYNCTPKQFQIDLHNALMQIPNKDNTQQVASPPPKNPDFDIIAQWYKTTNPTTPIKIQLQTGTTKEHPFKAVLRAHNNLTISRDGTMRYDASEIPITHIKPSEIGTSVTSMRKLGYRYDIEGNPLKKPDQIVSLFPQDILLPTSKGSTQPGADIQLLRMAQCIDDMLIHIGKKQPYYNAKKPKDLIGHLIIGLAPHTSAGIVGRIIGYTDTQGYYAHPLFHAAMRRDCDGDESSMMLIMDALVNFTRSNVSSQRGASMDTPLVVTTQLDPSEVDDMIFNMDVVDQYPLQLYEKSHQGVMPWEVSIPTFRDIMDTDQQLLYTHEVSNINTGVTCSAYKIIPSMEKKVHKQFELMNKIDAVDITDAAQRVLDNHLIKDIKGNLRKVTLQEFRCAKCNRKVRRPTMSGKCACGNTLQQTVAFGSVNKYLAMAQYIAKIGNISTYTQQHLDLLAHQIQQTLPAETTDIEIRNTLD